MIQVEEVEQVFQSLSGLSLGSLSPLCNLHKLNTLPCHFDASLYSALFIGISQKFVKKKIVKHRLFSRLPAIRRIRRTSKEQ